METLSENERKTIYYACEKFVNYHYPNRPKQELLNLVEATTSQEFPDVYGAGELIEKFENEIAGLLGKPAAVFMPSGTMAQVIAMRIWCDRKGLARIALHATSHLEKREERAYEVIHGLEGELLGDVERVLAFEDYKRSSGKFSSSLLELPHRELGGVLPEWSELEKISLYCRERGVAFHLDGARLWESGPHYQKSYAEICALFDSVYVSFYKGLGGLAGAVLAGDADFIATAKIWQKRQGGNLIRLYPYVISARDGLSRRLSKMKSYHEKAKDVAVRLKALNGIRIVPEVPHTNMMRLEFPLPSRELEERFLKIAREKKIGLFQRLVPTPSGCWCEFVVGDATLDLDSDEIVGLIKEALA